MRKSETYKSNFLKAEQLLISGSGKDAKYKTMVVTIADVTSHTFDDGKPQRVLGFKEDDRSLGLNLTNWDSVAEVTGKDDDDEWAGHKIELWVDKNVTYGGKKIPAIRIRPVGSGEGMQASVGVGNKLQAWTVYCHEEKKAGNLGPDNKADAEKFKTLVAAVAAKLGYDYDKFQAADWQSVIDEYHGAADGGVPISDIPF